MREAVRKGAALLVPSGPAHDRDRRHLHIIVSNPCDVDGHRCAVWVSVCSLRDDTHDDRSCILEPDDHPFLKHRSFVYYAFAAAVPVDRILAQVKSREIVSVEPVTADVLGRIIDGLMHSPHVKPRLRGIVRYENRDDLPDP